jgi:hypothetical protein
MAKTKISEWSATPANNTDIDNINIAEGCAPSGINDAIREMMAQIKDLYAGTSGDIIAVAAGGTGVGTSTGSGSNVLSTSPTLVTPALGTPSALVGTNITGTATSFNINGTVGATTPAAGAFTTLAASGAVTLSGGTANGVAYLNGSKVVTSGSALTFDGATLGVSNGSAGTAGISITGTYSGSGTVAFLNFQRAGGAVAGTLGYNDASTAIQFGTTTNHSTIFLQNNSEAMRLTSTGLGIGTSSPSYKLHTYGSNSVGALIQSTGTLATISFQGSGSPTSFSVRCGTDGQDFVAYTANTERMRLDSAGNLGLGVTPSAWGSDTKAIQMGGSTFSALAGNARTLITANAYNDGTNFKYINTGSAFQYRLSTGTSQHEWYIAPSGSAGANITFTQAMTLDSSGNLLVGRTGQINQERLGVTTATDVACSTNRASSTAYYPWIFYSDSATVGYIYSTSTTTTYATSSDYRLKNTITPMTGALAKIALLKPCTYKWKSDGSDGEGFIAHELAEVVPQCVTGEKDAVDEDGNPKYQGIDTSFLVATLTAALQEAVAKINSLEARLDAANL